MLKSVSLCALSLLTSFSASAATSTEKSIDLYQDRYKLEDPFSKLVDNHGRGFEDLYGTRNFRAVLNGVVYRGGANNAYHRDGKRNNSNPLPADGLTNLCEEGFGTSIYLYSTRYNTASPSTSCRSTQDGSSNKLTYIQKSVLGSDKVAVDVLTRIHQALTGTDPRPIYMHCWNGWHASGYISALTLRQFCGWSAEKAVDYWNKNTDGNNRGASYDKIRSRIRSFKPLAGMEVSQEIREKVCPN